MASYRKTEILSGLFILSAVGLFILFAFRVGSFDLFGLTKGESRVLETMLLTTETLEPGAKVTVGGVRVGSVTEMRLASPEEARAFRAAFPEEVWTGAYASAALPPVLVRFQIEKSAIEAGHELYVSEQDSRVFLQQEGFLGTHFLELFPGPSSEGKKNLFETSSSETRRVVAENRGLMAVVMRELKPTQDRLNLLLDRLNNGLLSESNLKLISELLTNMRDVTAKADESMALLNEFLGDGPRGVRSLLVMPASQLLGSAQESLSLIQGQLETEMFPRLRSLLDGGMDALKDTRTAIQRVDGLVEVNAPHVNKIMSELATAMDGLVNRLDRTEAMVQELGAEMKRLLSSSNHTISENRAEIAEMLRSFRRMAWEFEIFSRKLRSNPGVLLWGDDEVPLEALPTDQERHRRAGRAAPFDQREENRGK
ncbi:MAG TPA: MlaD family protein [Planctomycetota bacterium]|jgi:ABC-type transporter Mla subunit MlaD|nr:MlaD family protein [Planctomycetota bacterium]